MRLEITIHATPSHAGNQELEELLRHKDTLAYFIAQLPQDVCEEVVRKIAHETSEDNEEALKRKINNAAHPVVIFPTAK